MGESYQPRRKRVSRVRERYEARQRRRYELPVNWRAGLPETPYTGRALAWGGRGLLLLQDAWWHFRNTPRLMAAAAALLALVFFLFVGSRVVQGRVFPNVWSMGVYLGDLTVDEAEAALMAAWRSNIEITLVDGDRRWTASPIEMGLRLDARPVAEAARSVGMAGIPLGWDLPPVIEVDQQLAQDFLLELSQESEIRPRNASFRLDGDQVVGVPGSDGRRLNVALAIERLNQDVIHIVQSRRMNMIMTTLTPEVYEPDTYLQHARDLVARPFRFVGYDPFKNETISWETTPEMFVSWLEAGANGLTLRDEAFAPFFEAQVASLTGDEPRYLDSNETMDRVRRAIAEKTAQVNLRVRYRPTEYQVVYGDRAYGIARKTGIPYFLLEEANAGRDLNRLSPGDILNIPSRDATIPYDPVPHKRIIVNLTTQSLVAYESGREVFRWAISSGMSNAPTSPGTFQILNHDPEALGSSYTLCGEQGCGQWRMYWFMGIYEVVPGLMNGFHGAVLLPNGAYLGGGNVGRPYTFGCIMSQDDNARLLYEWAEVGTVVEIISGEYPPQSQLAQQVAWGG